MKIIAKSNTKIGLAVCFKLKSELLTEPTALITPPSNISVPFDELVFSPSTYISMVEFIIVCEPTPAVNS